MTEKLSESTLLDALVDFAQKIEFGDLPSNTIGAAKRRLLDSLGCAVGGWRDEAISITSEVLSRYGYGPGRSGFSLINSLGTAPWDAAYANTHMIRVLDWNDTYLSLEPAHPSDNIGALLAVCGCVPVSGEELLTAMVLAYDIQCRFCDAASLRARGWDHVAYVAIASCLAASKLLGLSREQMKEAVALAMRWMPLRQIRAGTQVSMAKGTSSAEATKAAVWSALLAQNGMTGPKGIMEGQFGFIKQISGPLYLETFDELGRSFKLPETYIKLYPVEYHAQAAVEAALKLRQAIGGSINSITRIRIETYEAAKSIIADPAKRRPATKESADHSLYYILAVTLLDGQMTLAQYDPSRLADPKVLALIDKMEDVYETPQFNAAYRRQEFPIRLEASLASREFAALSALVEIPKGHPKRPLNDRELEKKFRSLCDGIASPTRQAAMMAGVLDIETAKDVACELSRAIHGLPFERRS
ncbi:MAG: MmgE/PrpD family protein [bacterium]|nr:MmgE/PrpD family protein [bacterium]